MRVAYSWIVILSALLVIEPANAAEDQQKTFYVGPYFLGMTAASARKIGLENCKPFGKKLTQCDAANTGYSNQKYFNIYFTNNSNRIERIEASSVGSLESGKSYLAVPECTTGLSANNGCFLKPERVLSWTLHMNLGKRPGDVYQSLQITAEVNPKKVNDFLRSQRSKDAGRNEARIIQYGK